MSKLILNGSFLHLMTKIIISPGILHHGKNNKNFMCNSNIFLKIDKLEILVDDPKSPVTFIMKYFISILFIL